jgi:DNA-binding beta-propeller fold protein YncE
LGITVVVVSVLAGCSAGAVAPRPLPPAAEPATAPVPAVPPVGDVLALPAASQPEGITADPVTGLVAVALRSPDRIALVDAAGPAVVRVVDVPGAARHLELARPGGPVLVPGEDTDRLLQLGLPDGAVVASTPVGRQPHDAAYADGRVVVADELGGDVGVVDATGRLTTTLPGPVQPGGVAVLAGTVSAVDVRGARLYLWDERTLRPLGSVPVGAGPTHEAAVGPDRLLVTDTRGGRVLLVDPRARDVVASLALPGSPYGLATDPATGRAWVTLTGRNEVVQLHVGAAAVTEVRRWPTVRQPDTVAAQAADGCLFVTGTADAQLQRVCGLPAG